MPFPYLGESVWHTAASSGTTTYLPTCRSTYLHAFMHVYCTCMRSCQFIHLSFFSETLSHSRCACSVGVCACVPWYDFFYPGPPGTLSQANMYIYISLSLSLSVLAAGSHAPGLKKTRWKGRSLGQKQWMESPKSHTTAHLTTMKPPTLYYNVVLQSSK